MTLQKYFGNTQEAGMGERIDFEADANAPVTLSEDKLERLGQLAQRQRELERELAELQEAARGTAEQLRRVSEEEIPTLLDEVQLSELRLADGTKVIVKREFKVSTTGKHRDVINRWLTDEGHGDVIKDEVKVEFGAGEEPLAEELLKLVGEYFGSERADRKRFVHPQTFLALVKELLAAGAEVPLAELGVFTFRKTKLEAPR